MTRGRVIRVAAAVLTVVTLLRLAVTAGVDASTAVELTAPEPASLPEGDAAWLRAQLAAGPDGVVIDVPPGVYQGPFLVERPLTLRGGGAVVLRGDGTTHVVKVTAPDVTLDGFHIRGSGMNLSRDHAAVHVSAPRAVIRHNVVTDSLHGIYIRGGQGARIEDNTIVGRTTTFEMVNPDTLEPDPAGGEMCEVSLNESRRGNGIHIWNSTGHVIERNHIRQTRDGIYFSFVKNSDIRGNRISRVRYGLHYMYSDGNRFEDNIFTESGAGAALMFSKELALRRNRFEANRNQRAYGLLLQSIDRSTVAGNSISGNSIGLFLEGGSTNRVEDNRIARNHVGIRVSDSSDHNVFAGNAFVGNLHTVETDRANRMSRWTDSGRGNYWDGALKLDLDRNGIADLPHRELDLFGAQRRDVPMIGLLMGSPGDMLLRFVHARSGLTRLPGVTDASPLVSPEVR